MKSLSLNGLPYLTTEKFHSEVRIMRSTADSVFDFLMAEMKNGNFHVVKFRTKRNLVVITVDGKTSIYIRRNIAAGLLFCVCQSPILRSSSVLEEVEPRRPCKETITAHMFKYRKRRPIELREGKI
jgi:hypothetical protein